MPVRRIIVAAALAVLAGRAETQNAWEPAANVEQAVARVVASAMTHTKYGSREWIYFGARGGVDVRWNLAAPIIPDDDVLAPGAFRRSGWLSVGGKTGSVTACGDAEHVAALRISVADLWLGDADVIAELEARGLTITPILTRDRHAFWELFEADRYARYYEERRANGPAYQEWRLDQPAHDPAVLTAEHACTPPGTRHATYCWTTWTVVFRPDYSLDRPDDIRPGEQCRGRGRYGG